MEFCYLLDNKKVCIKSKIECLNLRPCECGNWAKWSLVLERPQNTENTEMQIPAINKFSEICIIGKCSPLLKSIDFWPNN